MVQHDLLNAGSKYAAKLCSTIEKKKAALPGITCRVEESLATSISLLNEQLLERTAQLKTALDTMNRSLATEEKMHYCHDVIFPAMQSVRECIDHLETLVATEYWPVPTYYDLLFSV